MAGKQSIVQVICGGFVALSKSKLPTEIGIIGKEVQQILKALSNIAERSSQWRWLKIKNPICAQK